MLFERELCLFFSALLKNASNLLRISLISFPQQKNLITVKLSTGCIQLNEKLVSGPKLGLTAKTVLKRKPLDFANARPMSLMSSSS